MEYINKVLNECAKNYSFENNEIVDTNIDDDDYGDDEFIKFRKVFEEKTYLSLCIEKPLDTIISNETTIILNDKRDDLPELRYLPNEEQIKYNNKIVVSSKTNSITLRDCLEAIINDKFYNNNSFSSDFDHRFLEDIYEDKTQTTSEPIKNFHLFLGS
jgi:hypothetical protein